MNQGSAPGSLLDELPVDCRIAVVRPGRLGDMVVLTPALRALRHAAPHAEITLICQRAGTLLQDRLPWVDVVVEIPDQSDDLRRDGDEEALRAFFVRMRRRHFHVALQCAGGGEQMNPFVQSLGAGVTVGQASRDAPHLDLCMPLQRPLQPESARLMDVMGLIGVPTGDVRPEIALFPGDAEELARLPGFDCAFLHQPGMIAVHVGSGSGSRRWPVERFARLLDSVLEVEAWHVALIGTEGEAPLAAQVRRQMHLRQRVHNLAGRLSLAALIGLISQVRLFVGNDSGPGHLATALNVPAVIIYGSGHPGTWAPASHLWQRPVAWLNAPCRFAGQQCRCPDDSTALCIAGVGVDDVQREVFSLLRLLATFSSPRTEPRGQSPGRSGVRQRAKRASRAPSVTRRKRSRACSVTSSTGTSAT